MPENVSGSYQYPSRSPQRDAQGGIGQGNQRSFYSAQRPLSPPSCTNYPRTFQGGERILGKREKYRCAEKIRGFNKG